MLYAWIYYLSTLYPFLGFCPWDRQQVVGLRSALDSTWFASVRWIANPLLANQVQQERKISGDRRWFIEVSLLKCTDGLATPLKDARHRIIRALALGREGCQASHHPGVGAWPRCQDMAEMPGQRCQDRHRIIRVLALAGRTHARASRVPVIGQEGDFTAGLPPGGSSRSRHATELGSGALVEFNTGRSANNADALWVGNVEI